MTLDDVADELYGLDPGEFVEARTARVAAARESKDRALATEIGKLRKPTVVGWLVNLLARELPDEVDALLALGEALRDAQRHLSGPDLRRLTTQRQQVVRALARKAGELAAERDRTVGEDALREVGQTLHAALADAETADQVRRGRVVTAATYSGFGPAGLAVVQGKSAKRPSKSGPAPTPPAEKPKKSQERDLDAERAAAAAELADATALADEARDALDDATAAWEQTRSTLTEIDHRIAELRAELDHAEQERQFTRNAETASAEDVQRGERDLETAERRVEEARRTLDDLG
ncbi:MULTISPECIES: hypothetical protein [unclassified Rhodococcus (in: high G+C Gram-positive bacteria)]|uniref:hypothetical protein n=1 Tax=unclassified Rhodococcus (in: high G+C Gram-positive bacteria) TaxID=192944 RepID=UPI001639599C|nr:MULTISPECIES: hypothetical protein [unclassified Rhodococcus (in: high G+C Gram-positive bacteria)]MBC2643176.1 hypothetical protein [Rhodococcus sp. 3A]MBC2892083.1 hypothetical protein [Rhodococcus sp. 4CII]